jgi:hypothetical protein
MVALPPFLYGTNSVIMGIHCPFSSQIEIVKFDDVVESFAY